MRSRRRSRKTHTKATAATNPASCPEISEEVKQGAQPPTIQRKQTLEAIPPRGALDSKHRGWLMTQVLG